MKQKMLNLGDNEMEFVKSLSSKLEVTENDCLRMMVRENMGFALRDSVKTITPSEIDMCGINQIDIKPERPQTEVIETDLKKKSPTLDDEWKNILNTFNSSSTGKRLSPADKVEFINIVLLDTTFQDMKEKLRKMLCEATTFDKCGEMINIILNYYKPWFDDEKLNSLSKCVTDDNPAEFLRNLYKKTEQPINKTEQPINKTISNKSNSKHLSYMALDAFSQLLNDETSLKLEMFKKLQEAINSITMSPLTNNTIAVNSDLNVLIEPNTSVCLMKTIVGTNIKDDERQFVMYSIVDGLYTDSFPKTMLLTKTANEWRNQIGMKENSMMFMTGKDGVILKAEKAFKQFNKKFESLKCQVIVHKDTGMVLHASDEIHLLSMYNMFFKSAYNSKYFVNGKIIDDYINGMNKGSFEKSVSDKLDPEYQKNIEIAIRGGYIQNKPSTHLIHQSSLNPDIENQYINKIQLLNANLK